MNPANPLKGALFALMSFAIYSAHDAIIKALGGTYTPFQIVFFAVLLGFPLAILMLVQDRSDGNLWPRHPVWTFLRTASVVVTGLSAFYAFSVLPLAQVYALLFMSPILITILAVPMLGESVGWRRGIASVLGLFGVLVVLDPSSTSLSLGHLAAAAAALANAFNSVIMRKIGSEERSIVQLIYPMLGNFLITGAVLPFVYVPMPAEDFGALGLIAILGFVAMMLIVAGYRYAPAVIAAPMQYSQIIWATIFGYWFFEEGLSWNTLVGVALIVASGIAIVLREKEKPETMQPVLRNQQLRDTGLRPRVGAVILFRRKNKR